MSMTIQSSVKDKILATSSATSQVKANVVTDALSRKERVKPRRVRAMAMTIQYEMERKGDESLYFMDRIWVLLVGSVMVEAHASSILKRMDKSGSMIQTLEDIMRACVIDFGGSYQLSNRCALFKALFGRKCRSPILWAEIEESSLIGPELVQEMTDRVVLIKEKLKAARYCQKRYADNRRKPLEFEIGNRVMLKVSPWKGVIHFGKKGKLVSRYVGQFEILDRIGPVAYQLRLSEELSGVHDTFHVSNLKKYLADASLHVPLDEIKVDKTLCFVEEPIEIMGREVKSLKRSRTLLVYEDEIKGQSSSSSNSQNVAFVSSENTSSTNEAVNTAHKVSTASSQGQASSSTYADDVMFSFFANQSNSLKLDNEDLEQIDTDDLEEIDLKWQVAMLTMRNQGNRNRDAPRRIILVETPTNALVVQDEIGGYDWSFQAEKGLTNFALIAYTSQGSSSSDSEVHTCSKDYLKSYETLQKQYDQQRDALSKSNLKITGYQMGLESLEARIVVHEKNEAVYEEDIAFLKYDVQVKVITIKDLKNQLEEALKEKDDLKLKLKKFEESLKNLTKLINSQISAKDKAGLGYDSQMNESEVVNSVFNSKESDVDDSPVNDRFKTGEGFHAVPPPYTRNYMPSRPDLSFAGLDDYVYKAKTKPKFTKINFVKSDENVKSINKENTHRQEEYPRKSQSPRDNRRNWNRMMTQKLGNGFEFIKKACFVCGSFNHLIKDCEFHDKKIIEKPVLNNNGRVTAVVTKSGQVPVNATKQSSPKASTSISTARPVSTVAPKLKVNDALPKTYSYFKAHSQVKRAFNQKSAAKTYNFNKKVYTAKVNNVTTAGSKAVFNAAVGNKENAGNPQYTLQDQGIFDSGCSRHMTGNKSFLTDYQEVDGGFELKFNLFSVSQMCDKKNSVLFTETECLVLSSDFKLLDESQVLLKVPRQNNMYSFDLKNVVPSGGLTCLFAKATIDESNLWHRRLGHINFKTMNKLVRGNLVRGLPSKLFENDHTCVACQKGKQHKASCKTKLDETSGILKTFITGIENQINHKVKIIRCDNGTEFKNNDMNQFCGMKGIKKEFSVARTSQQNGVVERKNRTLIEAARTMLADSLLPTTFWVEASSMDAVAVHAGKKTNEEPSHEAELDNLLIQQKEGYANSTNRDFHLGAYDDEDVGAKADLNNLEITINFWATAKSKIVNDVKQIHATVNGKTVVILESSVRSDLYFNDEDGITYKSNDEIFVNLALIGKLDSTSKKFLMYPRFLQLFLNNQIALPEPFNDIYVTPVHTKKVFTNMKRQSKDFSRRIIPLFASMLVPQVVEGEGSGQPSKPQPPSSTAPPSQAVYTGEYDRVVRAATTASSLQAEQQSGSGPRRQDTTLGGADAQTRFETASKRSHDPPLSEGNTSGSREDSMEHQVDLTDFVPPTPHDSPLSGGHTPGSDEGRPKFNELINLCTQLSNRVLVLENSKTAQDLVIQKLKKRVKRLEKALRARTPEMKLFKIGTSKRKGLDKENVSEQGRKSEKTKPMFNDSDFDVLDDAMENVEGGSTAEQITTTGDTLNTASIIVSDVGPSHVSTVGPLNVSAAGPSTSTAGDIFEDEMTTIADTLVAIRSARPRTTSVMIHNVEEEPRRATPVLTVQIKDKDKGKMVEPEPTPKNPRKAQIQMDEELAQRLFEEEQAQFEKEQRIAREKAAEQEANDAALIEQMEDVQARMDADELLAERLQQEERE
ncbi:ribonuclease H-like domain-containing protein [Tanacetum coccineum]